MAINRPVNAALYLSLVLKVQYPGIPISYPFQAMVVQIWHVYRIDLLRVGQPLSDGGDILLLMNLDDPIDLGSVAHQFHRAGVHHPLRRIAVHGKVVEQDVGD